MQPLVSIIIPVYNGANYMREAIDSALSQTYQNIEVIVVNDGSCDDGNTEAIAKSYGDKIRYFYKENGGVSSALNLGIQNMRGDFFSWLSHDDVYDKCKIESEVKAYYSCQKRTIISCGIKYVDNNLRPINSNGQNVWKFSNGENTWSNALLSILEGNTLNGCCLLIHKDTFQECGYFDVNLRFCQDAIKWIVIFLHKYSLYFIPEHLVSSRVHSGQLTQRGQELFKSEWNSLTKLLLNEFAEISSKSKNFYYAYVKADVKFFYKENYKMAVKIGQEKKLLNKRQRIVLFLRYLYGKVRPSIRRVYYRLFKRIKTS